MSAVVGVQHTSGKSRGELVTLFDSGCDDGLNTVNGGPILDNCCFAKAISSLLKAEVICIHASL